MIGRCKVVGISRSIEFHVSSADSGDNHRELHIDWTTFAPLTGESDNSAKE